MAEYLFRDKLAKSPRRDGEFEIRSRGITDAYERPGSVASVQGVEVVNILDLLGTS